MLNAVTEFNILSTTEGAGVVIFLTAPAPMLFRTIVIMAYRTVNTMEIGWILIIKQITGDLFTDMLGIRANHDILSAADDTGTIVFLTAITEVVTCFIEIAAISTVQFMLVFVNGATGFPVISMAEVAGDRYIVSAAGEAAVLAADSIMFFRPTEFTAGAGHPMLVRIAIDGSVGQVRRMCFAFPAAVPAELTVPFDAILFPDVIQTGMLPDELDAVLFRPAAVVAVGLIPVCAAGVVLGEILKITAGFAFRPAVGITVSGGCVMPGVRDDNAVFLNVSAAFGAGVLVLAVAIDAMRHIGKISTAAAFPVTAILVETDQMHYMVTVGTDHAFCAAL